jgi:hypothetical protein
LRKPFNRLLLATRSLSESGDRLHLDKASLVFEKQSILCSSLLNYTQRRVAEELSSYR